MALGFMEEGPPLAEPIWPHHNQISPGCHETSRRVIDPARPRVASFPSILHPASCILHPASCILHPSPVSRLPLPFKILLWFFLNLALLLAGFLLLFNTEYRFDLDWVFSSHAQGRVSAMRDLIVDDLDATAPEEWDEVIERFSNAYHVRLALFDEQGAYLLGAAGALPTEVRQRMHPVRPSARPHNAPPGVTTLRNEASASTMALLQSANPTRYWLLVGARVDNARAGGPMHVFLVADSASPAMGGLVIDPTPWLRLGAAAIILSVLFWLPLLRGITRAIAQVTDAARRIAQGHLDARVVTRRRDELGVLAEAINGMAVRLAGLLQGQKRFLGDVAHELCQPLARLQMTLGIIEQQATDERQIRSARTAMEKAGQIARLVDELLVFSRASLAASATPPQPVDVEAAARAAAAQEIPAADAEVRFDIPPGLRVLADPDTLTRALANLLRNALRYGGGRAGRIGVHAAPDRDGVAIRVTDTGPGVPPDDLPRLFDAFYRVDTARTRETGGVGLGLSIVKTGIEALGGSVEARNQPGGGLEVTLRLPAAPAAKASRPEESTAVGS